MATSVRITSAPETPDRAMQPKTKPPTPRRSKKRTLKVLFFTSIILPGCGIPYEPASTQLPGGPLMWRPQPMVKDAEGYHIFALDAQNPDKTPRMSTLCPPIHGLPCPPAAPPGVWMMCPRAARIGAHRSLRPVSGVLMDPLQPSERLPRLSRAAPAEIPAPQQPPWSAVTVRRHK